MSDLDAMGRHVAEEIAKQKQPGGLLHDNPMRGVLRHLDALGQQVGVHLKAEVSTRADHIVFMVKPENQKAAGVIVGIYRQICATPEGWQAAVELGFAPIGACPLPKGGEGS